MSDILNIIFTTKIINLQLQFSSFIVWTIYLIPNNIIKLYN